MRRFVLVLIMLGLVVTGTLTFHYYHNQNNILPLIRLHIIANSDSKADQQAKLQIRDQVIAYLAPKLKDVKNLAQARQIIYSQQGAFREIAINVLQKRGKNYDVKTRYGIFQFPPRNYGAVFLPAGEYEALRIILGNGVGHNWWCVLFPPLCLIKESGTNLDQLPNNMKLNKPKIKVESKLWQLISK